MNRPSERMKTLDFPSPSPLSPLSGSRCVSISVAARWQENLHSRCDGAHDFQVTTRADGRRGGEAGYPPGHRTSIPRTSLGTADRFLEGSKAQTPTLRRPEEERRKRNRGAAKVVEGHP